MARTRKLAIVEQAPVKKEPAPITREEVTFMIDKTLRYNRCIISKWSNERLSLHPAHAFEWGQAAIMAAAKIEVWSIIKTVIEDEVPRSQKLERINDYLRRKLKEIRGASGSTSMISNVMQNEVAVVAFDMLDEKGWGSDFNLVRNYLTQPEPPLEA